MNAPILLNSSDYNFPRRLNPTLATDPSELETCFTVLEAGIDDEILNINFLSSVSKFEDIKKNTGVKNL